MAETTKKANPAAELKAKHAEALKVAGDKAAAKLADVKAKAEAAAKKAQEKFDGVLAKHAAQLEKAKAAGAKTCDKILKDVETVDALAGQLDKLEAVTDANKACKEMAAVGRKIRGVLAKHLV